MQGIKELRRNLDLWESGFKKKKADLETRLTDLETDFENSAKEEA